MKPVVITKEMVNSPNSMVATIQNVIFKGYTSVLSDDLGSFLDIFGCVVS